MTLTELLHLRATEPRRFNELVAESLFGWRWWRFQPYRFRPLEVGYDLKPYGSPCRFFGPPGQDGPGRDEIDRLSTSPWDGKEDLPIAPFGTFDLIPPDFTADPAADLEAHRVACGWDDFQSRKNWHYYLDNLALLLAWRQLEAVRIKLDDVIRYSVERNQRPENNIRLMKFYQPGDYATAALLVALEAE